MKRERDREKERQRARKREKRQNQQKQRAKTRTNLSTFQGEVMAVRSAVGQTADGANSFIYDATRVMDSESSDAQRPCDMLANTPRCSASALSASAWHSSLCVFQCAC